MSILIKGMEMPQNCYECKLEAYNICLVKDHETESIGRPVWCPIAPVPDHGDLIDLQEAIIDANERAYDFWNCDADVDSTIAFLNEQPTIIPAEEVKTE